MNELGSGAPIRTEIVRINGAVNYQLFDPRVRTWRECG